MKKVIPILIIALMPTLALAQPNNVGKFSIALRAGAAWDKIENIALATRSINGCVLKERCSMNRSEKWLAQMTASVVPTFGLTKHLSLGGEAMYMFDRDDVMYRAFVEYRLPVRVAIR